MEHDAWLSEATCYWATEIGCPPEELFARPLKLKVHGPCLADYHGIFALFREDCAVISFPAEHMVELEAMLPRGSLTADQGVEKATISLLMRRLYSTMNMR